ncbi:SH3 domain-containing protein [Streptomyces sp. NPDC006602]|uniref:SH3 domain-containing protein n=1 Tax=Streptomyces sp. NPDC006602 TaxID=3364751 RepID=UPI0036AE3833
MSLRSRCAIAIAVSALVTTAATAAPAVADDDWGQGQSNNSEQNQSSTPGQNQSGNWQQNQSDTPGQNQGGDWGHGDNQRFYKGVVTASSLALRSAPNRGSQVIRYASRGEILSIFCKTRGENIQGDPLWYQIADDIWAWGAARYIDTIGPTPRWC